MKYVVIVHVKGAGALTSPIFGSLDLAEADVTKIRRFQHEAAGDITEPAVAVCAWRRHHLCSMPRPSPNLR